VENVWALMDAAGGEALVCVKVMHTNFSATSPARAAGWDGPLGAYPDHGCFRMPVRDESYTPPLSPVFSTLKNRGKETNITTAPSISPLLLELRIRRGGYS
jgi:hypothetical protein